MRKLIVAAMIIGAVQTAQAADMPDLPFLRGSFTDAPVRGIPIWQGYYVGAQAGYSAIIARPQTGINSDLQASVVAPTGVGYNWPTLGQSHSNNSGYGGFAGYNSQWDDVVIGFEANYLHSGLRAVSQEVGYQRYGDGLISTATSTAVMQMKDYGSLRARAGYAIGGFLPYAFGGLGIGYADVIRSVAADPAPLNGRLTDTKSKVVLGYSIGAGIDINLIGGLFFRAEYEYSQFTKTPQDLKINSVRAGLGYKF